MNNKQYEDCQAIIHAAAAASDAAGALPIPRSNSIAIMTAQTAMFIALGKVATIFKCVGRHFAHCHRK